jgi:RNA polymerase sigma-70 factor (sigma-E family)
LLRFGHVLTGSPQEAEELVQDALTRCLRRWRRVRCDDPVAYARRVMVNSQVTGWHRWGARVQLGDVPEAAAEDAELVRREEWDALRQALARLPRGQRVVLGLRYLDDLHDSSIAALLGCRLGTVRSRASRGLAALRPQMTAGLTGEAEGGDVHATG